MSHLSTHHRRAADFGLLGRAGLVAAMLALAAGVHAVALLAIVSAMFDPLQTTRAAIIVLTLLAVALGVTLPHQLVVHLVRSTWARVRRVSRVAQSSVRTATSEPPLATLWLVLAVILLGTAAVAVSALLLSYGLERVHARLLDSFLWTPRTLRGAQLALASVLLLPLWLLYGIGLSCVYAVRAAHSRSDQPGPRLAAWVLPALAVGIVVARVIILPRATADQALLLGAAPLFAAALLAARSASRAEHRLRTTPNQRTPAGPEQTDTTSLIIACLGCWGFIAGLILPAAAYAWPVAPPRLTIVFLCLNLAAMGFAAAAATRLPARPAGLASFALPLLAAGLLAVLTLVAAAHAGNVGIHISLLLVSAALGLALAGGKTVLSVRLASESVSLAELLPAILIGLAGGTGLSVAWLMPALGWERLVLLAGLLAAASAGLLAACDHHSPNVLSVGTTVGALAVMGALAVGPRADRVQERAGPGVSDQQVLQWIGTLMGPDGSFGGALVVRSGREAVRYELATGGAEGRELGTGNGPAGWSAEDLRREGEREAGQRAVAMDALRGRIGAPWVVLRTEPQWYDVVVIAADSRRAGVGDWNELWSAEFFALVRGRLAVGGLAVGVLGTGGLGHDQFLTAVATFADGFGQGRCFVGELGGQAVAVLVGCATGCEHVDWGELEGRIGWASYTYHQLLPSDPAGRGVAVNSLRQPRL